MNLKEYISSGTLELYIARMLSPEEAQEVDRMCQQHPEVAAEMRAIEEALAMEASVNVAAPPSDLLDRVMDRIDEEEASQSFVSDFPSADEPQEPVNPPRPLLGEQSPSSSYRWYLLAASVLLLASLALNLYLYRTYDQTREQLAVLQGEKEVLAEQFEGLRTNYQVLTDPRFASIRMEGQAASPESYATALWNEASGQLFLDVGNLPSPPTDKQYQLWAIIDGVGPVDAGVFDPEDSLLSMPEINGQVAAFAVTLEPRGGSESPTLEQMYVLGGT